MRAQPRAALGLSRLSDCMIALHGEEHKIREGVLDDGAAIDHFGERIGTLRQPELNILRVELHGRITDRDGIAGKPDHRDGLYSVAIDVQHLITILCDPGAPLQLQWKISL